MDRPGGRESSSVQERPVEPEQHQARPTVTEEMPPARRAWPVVTLMALVVLCIVGALAIRRWQGGQGLPEGLIQVNGRMEGDSVTIASKFGGRIAQLLAREGDTVVKGQVLVRIDDAQTRAQLDEAKAGLQMAIAQAQGANVNVTLTSATTSAQELQARGGIEQADRTIVGAHADLSRAVGGIASARAQLRIAEANAASAQAAVEAAGANELKSQAGLDAAHAQTTAEQANLRAAQALADSAQAAYERADHDALRLARLLTERAISEQAADQAELTAAAAKAQWESARRQVEAEEATLAARRAEADAARQQIVAADAAIGQARAQLTAAREQVAADDAGRSQAEAQARSARQMVYQAQARRQQAQADLNKARTAPQQVDISRTGHAQSLARVAQARASVHELESVLADLALISPVSGTVTDRMRDIGEVVSAGTPVLELIDLDRLYLKAYVPENQIGQIRLGLPVRIYVDAYPNTSFEATVGYIASTAEFTPKEVQTPDERVKLVYAVKLYVTNNAAHRLSPGMVADAIIRWKEGAKWQSPRW
jgi:HlyD family secretion protein